MIRLAAVVVAVRLVDARGSRERLGSEVACLDLQVGARRAVLDPPVDQPGQDCGSEPSAPVGSFGRHREDPEPPGLDTPAADRHDLAAVPDDRVRQPAASTGQDVS